MSFKSSFIHCYFIKIICVLENKSILAGKWFIWSCVRFQKAYNLRYPQSIYFPKPMQFSPSPISQRTCVFSGTVITVTLAAQRAGKLPVQPTGAAVSQSSRWWCDCGETASPSCGAVQQAKESKGHARLDKDLEEDEKVRRQEEKWERGLRGRPVGPPVQKAPAGVPLHSDGVHRETWSNVDLWREPQHPLHDTGSHWLGSKRGWTRMVI